MGYGWNTRSAEDVQHHNGRAYTFDKIAKRYEEVVPLRGKRKAQDIRPHGERRRDWERVVKVNDNEYYLTNNAYNYYEKHGYTVSRAITFKRDDVGNETITVHIPRQYWGDDRERLTPKQLGLPSWFFFYNFNLPDGLGMNSYYNKNYLYVKNSDANDDYSYYALIKGDVTVTRQVGDKYYKPLVVHREFKRSLDRKKTKAIRAELEGFKDYLQVMLPLAEANRHSMYSTPLFWANKDVASKSDTYISGGIAEECFGKGWRGLFTGEPNELTFKLVQYYKYQCARRQWNPETREYDDLPVSPDVVMKNIYRHVYELEKPLREEPVELGVRTNDAYKNW